jgi:hypothetical protein
MEACVASVSDGWWAALSVGGVAVTLLLVLWGIAEWSTRRYLRKVSPPEPPWRTLEEREHDDD